VGARQKKLESGTTLIFVDEAGYSLTPNRRRSWAMKGTIPLLRHSFRSWRKLSAQSAVVVTKRGDEYEVKLVWRLRPGTNVGARQVVEFLRQCKTRVRGDVAVIWDNAASHTAACVQRFFAKTGWTRIQLPPYCPELNADENVWNWTKQTDLANVAPRNHHELLHEVRASLRRLASQAATLRWCLWNTDLPWNRSDN
jgi:transposase